MAGARAHLPGGQGSEVDMRPFLLDGFTVRPSNTFREVEGIICLTGSTVTGKVKFWDQVGELVAVYIQVWMVQGKTFKMVDRPFASNVVRNHDVMNGNTLQNGCNDVVCVDVPGRL